MIIEDLIRLGRLLFEGHMDPRDVLRLVSDVESQTAKNFYKHVFVVEIADDKRPVVTHQVWGQEIKIEGKSKKADFLPDFEKAIGAPFVLPQGGNPLHPQGKYGVPAYPCWDKHIKSFQQSTEGVREFLTGRLTRTLSIDLPEALIVEIAELTHRVAAGLKVDEREKLLGVFLLVDMNSAKAAYAYTTEPSRHDLGHSVIYPGMFIEPCCTPILDLFWQAKLAEGAEEGKMEGTCTICGGVGEVISSYCKSWPWALIEWSCPLPHGGDRKFLVEGIALCHDCYRALVYGSCVFDKLSQPIHSLLIKEIFSPTANSAGNKTTTNRKLSDLPTVYGSGYLLPVLEITDAYLRSDFAVNIQVMLNSPIERDPFLAGHIEAVTGFDLCLPEDPGNDFRLSLLYFSGNLGRGDIHLRACIEDVLPSTLRHLKTMARDCADNACFLLRAIKNKDALSEKQIAYYNQIYGSVPWLLAKAYGGSYVWDQLQAVLHRRPLLLERHTRNVSQRMRSLAPLYPDQEGRNGIYDEVIFYLAFNDFATAYNSWLSVEGGVNMIARPWQELLKVVAESPIDELIFQSVAELGFACGNVIRQFGRQYYAVIQKDYLKHRVLTFGADLTPEEVWKRGLSRMFDVAERYDKVQLSDDFRKRVGVILDEYRRLCEDVQRNKDEFIASFWSGYALQGFIKPQSSDRSVDEALMKVGL